jgi:hypothetical protein
MFAAVLPFSSNALCGDESFANFFSAFSNDAKFSKERTLWPLRITTEKFGDPSNKSIRYITSGKEYWGTESTVSEFLKRHPTIRTSIDTESDSEVIVTFGIEDADIVFDFKFVRQDGYWRLVEVYDYKR